MSEKTEENTPKTDQSLTEWRWPIVVLALGLMVLIAFLYTIKATKDTAVAAKDATVDTAKEVTQTVKEISEAAITIAEKFQEAKITETFVGSLPKVRKAEGEPLEVATMENTKTIKRTEERTILWDVISLGKTETEIKVPATYRYHIRLADPWKLEVRDQSCIVIAPALRATTPVAIHTDRMEKRSDQGWARFNADEEMEKLEKSLTPRLNGYARSEDHLGLVREEARRAVAQFVKNWLLKEEHWKKDRFTAIHVIFADEANPDDYPAKPTLELN